MRFISTILVSLLITLFGSHVWAAELVDLKNQKTEVLLSFSNAKALQATPATQMKEINRFTDMNHITHVRMQEYFRDYPIWNAQAVIHMSASKSLNQALPQLLQNTAMDKSMNGQLYRQLNADLDSTFSVVNDKHQTDRALAFVTDLYKSKQPHPQYVVIKKSDLQPLVFVDKKQKAHWAYKISLEVPSTINHLLPSKLIYIVDAITFDVYVTWDDVKTEKTLVPGGGLGGNTKLGKLSYDGLAGNPAALTVTRDAGVCYLENNESVIRHAETNAIMQYPCEKPDAAHAGIYWSNNFDNVNGGYSPANDALFAAQVLKQFYKAWYHVPVLVNKDGTEMVLRMNVHVAKLDNAYWNDNQMTFGDGKELYPLTSLGIAAHEVSHGFTEQHAGLIYIGQSGAMNESFSDMAAQTAEFYAYGKSSWLIGGDIVKLEGETMRFMEQPSQDCYGKEPGTFCSIDSAKDYYDGLDVHFSSGVYNRAFYLLSHAPGWDPRKAFAVMLQANASYWVQQTQFADGAACVVKAAEDLHFNKQDVEQVFKTVGIDVPEHCTNKN